MNNQEFRQYLITIHGEYIINNLLIKDKLEYVQSDILWDFIMHYSRKTDNSNFCLKKPEINRGCPIPENNENRVSTDPQNINKRVVELQNWAGELNLESRDSVIRDIMVLGESTIHNVSQYLKIRYKERLNARLEKMAEDIVINPCWGLNLDFRSEKELNVKIDELESNDIIPAGWALWIYLGRIFKQDWEYIVKNIYITDLAHCNANSFSPTLEHCANIYFKKELLAIKPKILLILGHNICKNIFKKLNKNLGIQIQERDVSLDTDHPFYKYKYPQAGTLQIENFTTKFLVIPHPSRGAPNYKKKSDFWDKLSSWFWDVFFSL